MGRRRLAWIVAVLVTIGVAGGVIAVNAPTTPAPAPVPAPSSAPASPTQTAPPKPTVTGPAAAGVLRVYSNNIENLVRNDADGACTRFTEVEHLASMLVDDAGRTGTSGVAAPDLLLLQQVSGASQANAYADRLSARFGFPVGTYRAIVAWDDPAAWGQSHDCRVRALGEGKKQQTNAIVYNAGTVELISSATFGAGWLKPGTAYANGRGCTRYAPPNTDADPRRAAKWKRTTAVSARFRITATGVTVFAASMHLPQQNRRHACAGEHDAGMGGSGVRLSPEANRLLKRSAVAVIGVDANRTGLGAGALAGYGLTGLGSGRTIGRSKIDYLFVRGDVQPSLVSHTVASTRSNHLALYGFIDYPTKG